MKAVASSLLALMFCWAASAENYKYVFVDGVFDLPHYGHQQLFQSAIKEAAKVLKVREDQIRIIAGVSGSDEEVASYKRPAIYSTEERMREVSGFKGVYKVINSSMVTTREFMEEYGIDLVIAGGDYADLDKAKKYYADPIEMGKFKAIPRTDGISTRDLIYRTVRTVAQIVSRKLGDARLEERAVISRFLQLVRDEF